MTNTTLVILDEGSMQAKASVFQNGTLTNTVIPSIIALEPVTDSSGNLLDCNYLVDHLELAVDPTSLDAVSTKNAQYQVSPYNRAVIHELLRLSGFGGQDVDLIVTLPVQQFFTGNKKNETLIKQKKVMVLGSIEHANGQPLANIRSCKVAPESIPAWYNVLIDDQGKMNDAFYEAQFVMVVDIGGTTTDITLIDGTGKPNRKTSEKMGVMDVAERLTSLLIEEKIAKSVPRAHIDKLLRTGTYRNQDIREHIHRAALPIQQKIVSKLFEFMDDPDSLDHLVLAGGGAGLFGQQLASDYSGQYTLHLSDDPDKDVANGLLKAERLKETQP